MVRLRALEFDHERWRHIMENTGPVGRVDDDIAVVWSRYDFFVDGDVHHWGTTSSVS
jgi:hypothetical protein